MLYELIYHTNPSWFGYIESNGNLFTTSITVLILFSTYAISTLVTIANCRLQHKYHYTYRYNITDLLLFWYRKVGRKNLLGSGISVVKYGGKRFF